MLSKSFFESVYRMNECGGTGTGGCGANKASCGRGGCGFTESLQKMNECGSGTSCGYSYGSGSYSQGMSDSAKISKALKLLNQAVDILSGY